MIHSLDVKTRSNNVAMKIDMQKAYDRLNWSFLCKVMTALGLTEGWIDLVMRSIKGCHFGVLINGEASGFILSEHGLRQGDPLSPALFVIVSECLSRGLNSMFHNYRDMFYDTKRDLRVSHLAYVDDLIVFTKGGKLCLNR